MQRIFLFAKKCFWMQPVNGQFWMFSFENYADQSLDRRQKLIGMRLGMRFFIYGMTGSEIFIANAHVNTWSYITCKNYWNLARHVAALPANRWVQRFAIVASFWYSSRGPSTTYLGIQTSCVLQVRKSGIMERIGRRRVELTLSSVCQFLPHVNSSCVHIMFLRLRPKTA